MDFDLLRAVGICSDIERITAKKVAVGISGESLFVVVDCSEVSDESTIALLRAMVSEATAAFAQSKSLPSILKQLEAEASLLGEFSHAKLN